MMEQLYAHGDSTFDPSCARTATENLLSEPEFGGVWMIDSDGAIAGYIVVVLGYSLEFGGRFGLLDELFVPRSIAARGSARKRWPSPTSNARSAAGRRSAWKSGRRMNVPNRYIAGRATGCTTVF